MDIFQLGKVCTKIGSGATPRGGNEVYQTTGISLIRSQNVYNDGFSLNGLAFISDKHAEELSNVEVLEDDILLNITGDSVARVCQVPKSILPARVNQHVSIIRPDRNKLDPRFLKYYLTSPTMQELMLTLASAGATRKALTKGMIAEFEVPALPIQKQRTIAHILGSLDDKIELNHAMNETLEAIARAIFKSWFVDFDPVRSKAEGSDTGLPSHIAELFPNSFEDSELGEIPKGWMISNIAEISYVIDCLHSKKPERREIGKPLLQLWNISDDGSIDMKDAYYIDERDYHLWISRMEASPGDCVITNVGRVAAVAQIPSGHKAALGRNMTGIRCKAGFQFPTFLIECLQSEAMKKEILTKIDTGTILDALNVRNIPKLRFALPNLDVLHHFEQITRPLKAKIEENSKESQCIAAIRNALLPKLLSGEIRVKD
jgi:type I restriction enzyme, S subunit